MKKKTLVQLPLLPSYLWTVKELDLLYMVHKDRTEMYGKVSGQKISLAIKMECSGIKDFPLIEWGASRELRSKLGFSEEVW